MYNQEDFINRCQKLAIDNHTNLRAITREIGVSNSSFTDWKKGRGKPSIETFCKLADYFNVTLDFLAYGVTAPAVMEFSTSSAPAVIAKFNRLTPDLQRQVMSYMDGMIATLNATAEIPEEKRLSV